MATIKVELAYPWQDKSGKQHEPDEVVQLEAAVARSLIGSGRARLASSKPAPAPTQGVAASFKKEAQDGQH